MALPENHPARTRFVSGVVAAGGLARVPDGHLFKSDPHLPGGIPSQVLVWEKKNALASGERPLKDGTGVRAGANDAAVPPAEGFEIC